MSANPNFEKFYLQMFFELANHKDIGSNYDLNLSVAFNYAKIKRVESQLFNQPLPGVIQKLSN